MRTATLSEVPRVNSSRGWSAGPTGSSETLPHSVCSSSSAGVPKGSSQVVPLSMTVPSWLERAEAVSGIRSTQLAGGELVQDLLAARRHVRIFLLDLEAHGRHDLVQAGDDG